MRTVEIAEQRCAFCKEVKRLDEFYKDRTRKNGHQTRCKPCGAKRVAQWKKANPEKVAQHNKKWSSNPKNRDVRRRAHRRWHAKKMATDPKYAASYSFRRTFRLFTTRGTDGWKIEKQLGFTHAAFVACMEAQFRHPMSWENYGTVWVVDHIRPVVSFGYPGPDDPNFKECWSLENMQPLFVHENSAKGAKCEEVEL